MPRRLSGSVDERIATLHRARQTEAQIATVLAREGTTITPSGVHRALSRLGLAPARKAAGKSKNAPVAAPKAASVAVPLPLAEAPASVDELEHDDVPTRLRRVLASLERVAAQAEADKDVARVVAAQRAITQATSLLSKATPPPAVDVDAQPDMVAAAKRGREQMHVLFDRLLGEKT